MNKKLYRSHTDKKVCGVCGGLAQYFDMDPTVMRLVVVAVILFTRIGLLAYFVAALIIPKEPNADIVGEFREQAPEEPGQGQP